MWLSRLDLLVFIFIFNNTIDLVVENEKKKYTKLVFWGDFLCHFGQKIDYNWFQHSKIDAV